MGSLSLPCPKFFNPADFVLDISTVDLRTPSSTKKSVARVEKLINNWRQSEECKKMEEIPPETEAPIITSHTNNWFHQLAVLLVRDFKSIRRSKPHTVARIMQSLIIGLLYLQLDRDQAGIQNRTGYAFFTMINALFGALMILWTVFPIDRRVFWRERASGMYGTSAWFLSRSIVELPLNALMPFIFCVITYWMAGLQADPGKFFLFCLFTIMFTLAAEAYALFFTCLIIRKEVLAVVNGLALIPMIMFGGFYANDQNTPDFLIWLKYASFVRYSFEGAITAIFQGLSLKCKCDELVTGSCTNPNARPFNDTRCGGYEDPFDSNPLFNETLNRTFFRYTTDMLGFVFDNFTNSTTAPECDVCPFTRGSQVIDSLGFEENPWGRNFAIILAMVLFYKLLAYLCLR